MKYTGQQMNHLLYYNLDGDFRAYSEWSECDYSSYETKAAYSDCPKDIYKLRLNEMITYPIYAAPYEESDASADDWLAMCWVSNKPYAMVEAFFSIFLTICIAALLGVMAYLFSRDADMMVIKPIESMVDSVTKLAANPAYKLEAKKEVKYETDALYVSLAKIAQLLQVGFGEAGNNLVAENLKKGDTVDPMVPGKMLLGAYGFCIIDDYEEVRSRRDLGLRCDLGGAGPRRDLGAFRRRCSSASVRRSFRSPTPPRASCTTRSPATAASPTATSARPSCACGSRTLPRRTMSRPRRSRGSLRRRCAMARSLRSARACAR